jgi:hypothetical protein
LEPPLRGKLGIPGGHLALHLNTAPHGIDNAGELDQKPIASRFDDAAVMLTDSRIGDLMAPGPQPRKRPFFVLTHQTGVTGDVGRQNRREVPSDARAAPKVHATDLNACACAARRLS